MVLTVRERIFLVQSVLANGEEYLSKVQEEFKQQLGDERLAHRIGASALIKKFKETATVYDKIRCERPKKDNRACLE